MFTGHLPELVILIPPFVLVVALGFIMFRLGKASQR